MSVPNGVIVAWPSTAASIPSGWTRETGMDAKYFQGSPTGADADLVTSRGAATHTHTSPSHTPVQNAHTHGYTLGNPVGGVSTAALTEVVASTTHTHSGTSASATATNNGIAITVNANSSNDLVFKEVIFIKSDGTPLGIPANAYAFFASDILPSGWTRAQGNTYLKGAAVAGNGGGTGGSNTHTHTSPAHTHTQNAHTHGAALSGDNIGNITLTNNLSIVFAADDPHQHSVSLNATTATNNSVTTTINSSNHEPIHKKLNVLTNGTGGESLPEQIIALWGGSNASIPSGWSRFTSMDGYFLKGANADGESNVTTGGAATHTHTASNCQPIQPRHLHTASIDVASVIVEVLDVSGPGDPTGASDTHTHTAIVSFTIATNQATTVTINANTAESAYPPYVRVIFIQLAPATPPPAISGYTSYDLGLTFADIGAPVLPEIEAAIRRGDQRYIPR